MLYDFLFILGFVLVACTIILILKFTFKYVILQTSSVTKSIFVRKIYFVIRILIKIVIAIVGLILLFMLIYDMTEIKFGNQYIFFYITIGYISLLVWLLSNISLPVSLYSIKRFKKKYGKKDYVLYLRGFVSDDYTPNMENVANEISKFKIVHFQNPLTEKANPKCKFLDERNMAKAWRKHYPIFSVGRPNELESPQGTKRIFLDNSDWKENVLDLISKAKYIVICVNPNDNCIWEILQCQQLYSNKTIYYVDYFERLKLLIDKLGTEAPKCLSNLYNEYDFLAVRMENLRELGKDPEQCADFFIHSLVADFDNKYLCLLYSNDYEGYMTSIRDLMVTQNTCVRRTPEISI